MAVKVKLGSGKGPVWWRIARVLLAIVLVVGILGGSSGTTYDAFKLLADGRKHGARVALFGRRIKDSEHPLEFIRMLRLIADGEIEPQEAVKSYHSEIGKHGVKAKRTLEEDLLLTPTESS